MGRQHRQALLLVAAALTGVGTAAILRPRHTDPWLARQLERNVTPEARKNSIVFWDIPFSPMPSSVPTARAALRALSVADHSRVRQDGPGRCRANFFFPIDALVVSLADYMTSWGAVCQPVAYVYSSEWHLLSILQGQLGLCTASGGNGTRSSDDIALVVPQRMHDGTMAPLHSCVDSPAVWIFSTEQFSNPLYLSLTTSLIQQGWRAVEFMPQHRCLLLASLCSRGAILPAKDCEWATLRRGAAACTKGVAIAAGSGQLGKLARSCKLEGTEGARTLECPASATGAAVRVASAQSGTAESAMRVVPYQLTSEVAALSRLLEAVPLAQRRHDVAFVGFISPRRKTILLALQRAGVRLVVANGLPSTRDAVVASARVLVNIHGNDEQTMFETMRCDRWIAAGHVVVSEPSWADETSDFRRAYIITPDPTEASIVATTQAVLKDINAVVARIKKVLDAIGQRAKAKRASALEAFVSEALGT
mmetsp:Transcript_20253/g.77744  ORF Transcript_20253/g.77744 Transcript_20253/m.77744 type:complete len:479 (-) Transcript_20253:92-1528(-)